MAHRPRDTTPDRRERTSKAVVLISALVALACGCTRGSGDATGSATLPEVRLALTLPLRGAGRGVAFAPSGQLLAVASVDSTIRLWRLPAGAPLGELRHPAGVTALAFSPDGRELVSASYDGIVRRWDAESHRLVSQWPGNGAAAWTVAVSPDGQLVASAGEDQVVRVRSAEAGATVQEFTGHERNVWSVAFSPDSRHIVSGSFDRSVRWWDLDRPRDRTIVGRHGQAVVAVATSATSGLLASAGDDATINLWDAASRALVRTMRTGADHVYSLAFSQDGRWLVSAGRGQGALGTVWKQLVGPRFSARGRTVRVWRVADGALLHTLRAHDDDAWGVAISPNGEWIAASGEDNTVRVWRWSPTASARRSP